VVDENKSAGSEESKETNSEGLEEKKTFTAEDIKALQFEAKTYRKEKADLKKDRDDFKAKLDALEAAKLTETEKDKLRIAELEKKLTDTDNAIKSKEIDTLIVEAISDKNIIDKSTAKLLIKNELASEEVIDSKVVDRIVEKLLKDKPYLVNSTNLNPSPGNFKKQDNEVSKKPLDQLNDFISGKTTKLS
jgi:hypothetical protein